MGRYLELDFASSHQFDVLKESADYEECIQLMKEKDPHFVEYDENDLEEC